MGRRCLRVVRINASPERLREMRAAVREVLAQVDCEDKERRLLVLAVSEACMNVIQHGYKGDLNGEIILEIFSRDGELEFLLTDFAKTVDPSKIKPRPLAEVRPGGLGIHFIQCIMDEYRFTVPRGGKGNLLIMRKKVKRIREAAENAM